MDGPVAHSVQRLRLYEEPAGSFAIDHTGTLGDFVDVPITEGSMEADPGVEHIDPGTVVQGMYDFRKEILGKRGWSLSFTLPLAPTGTPAGSTTPAIQSALGKLLKIVLGGEHLSTGSAADGAWSDAEGGDVLAGTSMLAGTAIGWLDSNGVLHARELEQGAGTALTSKVALPAAPAAADVIYGSATYYLASSPKTSAQFIVEGLEDDDRWVLMGGQGTVSLELPLDGTSLPTATFEFAGRSWLYGRDAATDLTAAELAPAQYSDHEPIPGHVGELLEQNVGEASPISKACVSSLSFALSISNQEVTCPSAPDGLLRWMRTRQSGPAVTGAFTTFFADLDRFEDRDNRSDKYLAYRIGTEPGETILITAPCVQYGPVQRVDADGIASETVNWKGRGDRDTVATPATDLSKSPFRIHFL